MKRSARATNGVAAIKSRVFGKRERQREREREREKEREREREKRGRKGRKKKQKRKRTRVHESHGRLCMAVSPVLRTANICQWEFNFRDRRSDKINSRPFRN